MPYVYRFAVISIAVVLLAFSAPTRVFAGAKDYRFEAATPPTKSGSETLIKVRLIHIPDGRAVSDAVIFRTRFDMGPAGMPTMTAPAKLTRADGPGIYELKLEPPMAGSWELTLAAKVQGETDTVTGTVPITIGK